MEYIAKKKEDLIYLLPRLCSNDDKRKLATNLANKLILLFNEAWDEKSSLQNTISSLRYILESLIQVKLLNSESGYFEKIHYGITRHLIKKHQLLLERATHDLELLNEYKSLEEKLKPYKGITGNDAKSLIGQQENLYKQLDMEFSIFLDPAEYYGIDFYASQLKEKMIPEIEKEIQKYTKMAEAEYKALTSNLEFNRKFEIRGQSSKIPKVLSDSRTWKKKAQDVGLLDEYSFLYDYTSSILHATSYSIYTNTDIEKPEYLTLRSLANKLMTQTVRELFKFCDIPYNTIIVNNDS